MRVFVFVLVLALSVVASPIQEHSTRIDGENGWYIPQVDDVPKWVTMPEFETLRLKESRTAASVRYYMFTRTNSKVGKEITASQSSVTAAGFNPKKDTIVVIHGWIQNYNEEMYQQVRDAFFKHIDCNIVSVDWARARGEYISAVAAVPATGKTIAEMLDYLATNHGLSLSKTEVIGHSLGAQVSGHTGKNVRKGQIHRIVGLDPAKPGFTYEDRSKRLCDTDAFYVESIHTSGDCLGFLQPIGNIAFYPNGGKTQPGCPLDVTCMCSHQLSVFYFVEGIVTGRFSSVKCNNYEDAVKKSCGNNFSGTHMGSAANAYKSSGAYYVPVNKNAPYST